MQFEERTLGRRKILQEAMAKAAGLGVDHEGVKERSGAAQ
jgi:hypothetical protein